MLDATKPRHLRQVEHLPRLGLHDRPIRQIPPAALAAINQMRDRLIRILTAVKMMIRMPGLTTRLAAPTGVAGFLLAGGLEHPSDDGGLDELREF